LRHSFLDRHASLDSPVHQLDARAKILFLLALVLVCVSTPPERWSAFVGYFLTVGAVILASRVPLGYVLTRWLLIVPFVLLTAAFIPFLRGDAGGGYSLGVSRSGLLIFWNVLAKSFVSILCVIALTSTTKFAKLLAGLSRLGLPKLMLTLLSFAYRYIFVVVDEGQRMKRARDSRGYAGRWLRQAGAIGRTIGLLFLRSYERAERVHMAMVARGFDGNPARAGLEGSRMSAEDYAFVLVGWAAVIGMRVFAR
jgi:cobalt/nickel transport system permease protein